MRLHCAYFLTHSALGHAQLGRVVVLWRQGIIFQVGYYGYRGGAILNRLQPNSGLTKFVQFGPFKSLDKICLYQILNLSSVGALRNSKIMLTTSANHAKKTRLNLAAFNLISRDVICTCTRLTRMVCIWLCIWSVCIGMYKVNSTWLWRCNWNVNLRTVIDVFLVRIIRCRYESSILTV